MQKIDRRKKYYIMQNMYLGTEICYVQKDANMLKAENNVKINCK